MPTSAIDKQWARTKKTKTKKVAQNTGLLDICPRGMYACMIYFGLQVFFFHVGTLGPKYLIYGYLDPLGKPGSPKERITRTRKASKARRNLGCRVGASSDSSIIVRSGSVYKSGPFRKGLGLL